VVGGLILAASHKRLSKALLWEAMVGTMRLTAMVVFILIGSRVFSQVFQGVDGSKWVEHLLTGLPGGQVGFLIVVNVFVFFLAFFLDFFEIAFIIVPMLAPVADKLGINLIWFGVLLCVNLQTSFMHPPFGFALFYLRGIADTLFKEKRIPEPVKSNDIYLGSIPWVIMQLILVVVVIFVPQTVTVFLDKEVVVDVDKVKIEVPADAEAASKDPAEALKAATSAIVGTGTAAEIEAAANKASDKASDDEQKKMDDLFKDKK
jgi:TRAP-type mannitol/chloroaromatic compound transport system permease large subunit